MSAVHKNMDDIFDLLADAVAERVAKIIGRKEPAEAVVYTTKQSGPHIPGKTRRWMRSHVKTMPGARKVGRDWEISVALFNAWATAEDARRCMSVSAARPERPILVTSPEPTDDLAARAARSLEAQGYRKTRG